VRAASIQDWDAFIRALPSWPYPFEYTHAGKSSPLPPDARALFAEHSGHLAHLQTTVGPVALNCHFFTAGEIEFDLDPRQVDSAAAFDAVLGFMQRLGSLVMKPVVLTPENSSELVIIRYRPEGDSFEYVPP
jgi:hypothetical protein